MVPQSRKIAILKLRRTFNAHLSSLVMAASLLPKLKKSWSEYGIPACLKDDFKRNFYDSGI